MSDSLLEQVATPRYPVRKQLVGVLVLNILGEHDDPDVRVVGADCLAAWMLSMPCVGGMRISVRTASGCAVATASSSKATEIYRRLASANPVRFDPDLAAALNNLSVDLGEVGRSEEAMPLTTEAVEIHRRLAGANPAVFEADLAQSLNNLGRRLSELGQREETLAPTIEALEIRRRLAAANPAAFEPHLPSR